LRILKIQDGGDTILKNRKIAIPQKLFDRHLGFLKLKHFNEGSRGPTCITMRNCVKISQTVIVVL